MAYSGDPAPGARVIRRLRSVPASIAVVVPAHNEEQLVGRCLESLHAAIEHGRASLNQPCPMRVVVLLDDCSDRTERIVAADRGVSAIRVHHRRVGAARRVGAEYALDAAHGRVGWLASTDADTEVPADWLTGMVELALAGADLVLGTVQPWPELSGSTLQRYRAGYHAAQGHRHVHGANMGISANAYLSLGGWPETERDEDVALVGRAEAAGLSIARTGAIPVRTSSRLTGRAPSGFASHLAALAEPVR